MTAIYDHPTYVVIVFDRGATDDDLETCVERIAETTGLGELLPGFKAHPVTAKAPCAILTQHFLSGHAEERYRAEQANMADAHAEGLHDDLAREGCPDCEEAHR